MDRLDITKTVTTFKKPTSARQAAEALGITKAAVLNRIERLKSLGAVFKVKKARVGMRGPLANLLTITKEPVYERD